LANILKKFMRKHIINLSPQNSAAAAQKWLDLENLAHVQITSEEETNPIELALLTKHGDIKATGPGWLAAEAGEQTLRICFDNPQNIQLIHVLFRETQQSRTQEFLLRYSKDQGESYHAVLRQQYTFNPPHTSTQVEEYHVRLEGVTILELTIIPNISGGNARASLTALRLA
jgi:hypothetical protein